MSSLVLYQVLYLSYCSMHVMCMHMVLLLDWKSDFLNVPGGHTLSMLGGRTFHPMSMVLPS